MSARASIVWFRQDLRLEDHPALGAAVQRGGPIIPVFIWPPEDEGAWTPGAASRWWLRRSLMRLNADLRQRGSQLSIRRGDSTAILQTLVRETGAAAVFWNRRYEPTAVGQERSAEARLRAMGLTGESFNAGLLVEPGEVRTRDGKPYQVFTPFWKACLSRENPRPPLPAPEKLTAPPLWPESLPLEELRLEPTVDWAAGVIHSPLGARIAALTHNLDPQTVAGASRSAEGGRGGDRRDLPTADRGSCPGAPARVGSAEADEGLTLPHRACVGAGIATSDSYFINILNEALVRLPPKRCLCLISRPLITPNR